MTDGRFTVDSMAKGASAFYCYAEKRYAARGNGPFIPPMSETLFNGNIVKPVPIFIVLILAPILMTGCTVFVMSYLPKYESLPTEVNTESVNIDKLTYDDDYIDLECEKGTISVPKAAILLPDELERYVGSGEELKFLLTPWRETKEDTEASAWEIKDSDGQIIASSQSISEAKHFNNIHVIKVLASVSLVAWLLFGADCYILNNADRHPKLARLLLKSDCLNV